MSDHDVSPAGQGAGDHEVDRDHFVLSPRPWLAGCSDVGRRHLHNQDALALAGRETDEGRVAILVISDGVSTSIGSEVSAAVAAEVTCNTLVAMLRTQPGASVDQVQATLEDACRAANDAVLSTPGPGPEPGSCTLVAAVANRGQITVGNIGDCRAYWIGDDDQASLLSVDDSMAQVRIDMGMSREEAETSFQAHAITRWLGPDSKDATPRQISFEQPGAGWLMVCSDGLWNYCSPADQMRALVHEAAAQCDQRSAETTAMLVSWANEQGGRDNITVALARLEDPHR